MKQNIFYFVKYNVVSNFKTETMKVIIDSNTIIGDFFMKSPNFTLLLDNSKNKQIDLYIPQIVIDEVVNKYEQQLSKIGNDLITSIKKYNKLSESEIISPITETEIQKKVEDYRYRILKIFNESLATILDYPKVDHSVLAKKAMTHKKPFNSNEKGYRDNLIWENIKSIISDENPDAVVSPDLVFLSGNHTDFAGNKNELHEDLLRELIEEDKSQDVILYESLGEFNEKVSKLYLAEAIKFKEKIENKDFWDFDLKNIIDKFLYTEFIESELHSYREYTPYANDHPIVYQINDEYELNVTSVKQLSSTEFLIDVDFNLETDVTYFMDKYDYWSSDDSNIRAIDLDWNDHVVFVESQVLLPLSVSLIVTSELKCISIEINKIDNEYE